MTDREYVESTVAYLAQHVPWMWKELLYEYGVSDWEQRGPPARIVESKILDNLATWLDRKLVTQGRPDNPSPLVSADWWDERGEPKLAELLRKQSEVTV